MMRRRILTVCAVVAILALMLLLLYLWENHYMRGDELPEDDTEDYLWYEGDRYRLRDGIETLLVIGLDKFEEAVDQSSYNNDQQADFLMLLVIDHAQKTCSAVHINRDTMAEVTVLGIGSKPVGTVTEQLALSHTYGSGGEDSCRNTVKAVEDLLDGPQIDHYISLTMDAVSIVNDMVGGVTLTVLDDLSSADPALKQGETVTLMGAQALTYVRNRFGLADSSNVARMNRQRQYLDALYHQTMSYTAQNGDFSMDALLRLSDYMVSDCSLTQMDQMLDNLPTYTVQGFQTIEGQSVVGPQFMEFHPDPDALKQLTLALFCERA